MVIKNWAIAWDDRACVIDDNVATTREVLNGLLHDYVGRNRSIRESFAAISLNDTIRDHYCSQAMEGVHSDDNVRVDVQKGRTP